MGTIQIAIRVGMEFTDGLMEALMKDIGKTTRLLALEFTNGLMAVLLLVSGLTASLEVLESLIGLRVAGMKDSLPKTNVKVTV